MRVFGSRVNNSPCAIFSLFKLTAAMWGIACWLTMPRRACGSHLQSTRATRLDPPCHTQIRAISGIWMLKSQGWRKQGNLAGDITLVTQPIRQLCMRRVNKTLHESRFDNLHYIGELLSCRPERTTPRESMLDVRRMANRCAAADLLHKTTI